MLIRTVAIASGWIIIASATYDVWQFPAWLAWALSLLAFLTWLWWTGPILAGIIRRLIPLPNPGPGWPFLVVAVVADALILVSAVLARTDEGLISPWQVLPIAVFGLFFLGTLFILFAFPNIDARYRLPFAILHTFVAYSTSMIVYKLGFGFDPFVHEAATNYIVQHGAVEPKTPFYIGQYVVVAAIRHLTGCSVAAIQAWLLPLLASMFLPCALALDARRPYWIAWVLPFAYFTFTVPFNLGLLGLVLCLLIPGDGRDVRLARFLLAGATLAIHPLVGIPAFAFVLAREISLRWKSAPGGWLAFACTFGGLVTALSVYAFGHGGQWAWPDIQGWIGTLLTLFRPPFETLSIAPLWSVLYIFYALWPWLLTLLASRALLRRTDEEQGRTLPIGIGAGLLGAAIVTAGAIRYKDIVSYEQYEFALRLIALLPWVLLPGLLSIFRPSSNLRTAIVIAALATAMWHVSYPQLNPVMHVYSPGVSRTDFLTVEEIERIADGRPYAALVPQLTSAAALRQIGFGSSLATLDGRVYPYAIPTGGYLYARYLELFDGRPVTDVIRDTRASIGAELLFIAIPFSWDDGHLDAAISPLSVRREVIDESMRLYAIENAP